ncbi:UbiA family prenyltransferase [Methanobrevibacter sp. OttesenSCG-928-K11]|nr:UbiA family prenyltransferase [Methanobrevibacter sp. OttesenSCG-928-K11]MDL2270931.1 UbiA family prenyltransferase [Methanobrevibacter sp. OttesenSCG-928-I08]
MNPYIEIIRPGNVLMALIVVILVAIIANTHDSIILLAILAVFFAISGGNVINDCFDHKIDSINRPDRPIPSGRISLKNGRNYAYILLGLAIIMGFIISYLEQNIIPGIIVLISVFILYFYASKFKSTVLLGNFIVGFMTGLCFVFAGYVIGIQINSPEIITTSFYLGFFALVMTMAREITKDMEDIEGDKKEDTKTLPIVYGLRKSSYLTTLLVIIACGLSPILYVLGIFDLIYLIIMIIAILLFLYGAIILLKDQSKETCHKTSKYLKIGMLISFIAFALGSFNLF